MQSIIIGIHVSAYKELKTIIEDMGEDEINRILIVNLRDSYNDT